MNNFIKLFQCCNEEEIKKAQDNSEFHVPINNFNENNNIEQSYIIEKNTDLPKIEVSKIKSNENNNTMNTKINTNNTSNNNIIDDINSNVNKNIENKINNIQKPFSPSKKRILYSNSISHKIINNNLERGKSSNSLISKSNNSKNLSNNGSILTLNNLILISQCPEEKKKEIGFKLLLSGELFFWKEIIISPNGIKNSLKKQKNDHVLFGIKNILNKAGEPYNDFIINFFYDINDAKLIETNTCTIFDIFFNKKIKEYIFHFYHPNLILYYKINTFVYFDIGREYYFLLGNIFVSISVRKNSPIEKIINVQIEVENNNPLQYSFNQNQTPIKIGRINSDINIFNSSISKRHGVI